MRQILLAVITTTTVHADGVMPHVNAGLEVAGSGDAVRVAARAHVGASIGLGHARVRPSLGLGVTLAAGFDEPEDRMEASSSYRDATPELQLGVRIGDGGVVDNRVFVGFARWGDTTRVSLAASMAELSGRVGTGRDAHPMPHDFLLLVMPQQIEFALTKDDRGSWFGITMAYGI